MINPDQPNKWQGKARFDRFAVILIGLIALLGAILGVVHTFRSLEAGQHQMEGSRLATDLAARIGVMSVAGNMVYTSDNASLYLQMQGFYRASEASETDNLEVFAVSKAYIQAADDLQAALTESQSTIFGQPVDPYTVDLLKSTDQQLEAEVMAQNHEMDLAEEAGLRERIAFLGLSILALAGVLTGLAAVLKQSRAGWLSLGSAAGMVVLAAILAFVAIL